MSVIEVVAPGIATSVRDGGRPTMAHLGSSRGGAVDLGALHLANRLVGNPPHMAAFETSGGLVLRVRRPVMVAVTGSPVDLAVDAGPPVGWGSPVAMPAGSVLRLGRLRGGARCYIAVRGGLVANGTEVGPEPFAPPSHTAAVPPILDRSLRVWPGPRLDWFVDEAWHRLTTTGWTVTAHSDRMGLRLDGASLDRLVTAELVSEGLVEGAIQVPPDGRPIVMLADHPTTGGYPVIAVVDPADVWLAAQRPPGGTVRFVAAARPRLSAQGGYAETLG
ncbi:MAG: biotin-dependent carboxyltransferase family protein [Ilumatobacteraceae bacterium]